MLLFWCRIFLTGALLTAGFAARAADPSTDRLAAIGLPRSPVSLSGTALREPDSFPLQQEPLAGPNGVDTGPSLSADEQQWIFLKTVGISAGVITVYGIISWDYFTESPNARREGWFGYSTKHGGVDKLGHAYTSYVTTHIFAALYERSDFPRGDAAVYGTLTSLVLMTYMEFGDSFSEEHGFSIEDFLVNTVGCAFGYLTWRYPGLAAKVDLRWEYGFHPGDLDITTDYENSKFLIAIKLNGWEACRDSFLRHLEFHVGYYTRGYNDDDGDKADRERHLYVGLGLNLTDFLRRRGYRRAATFFNYYQLPYTYYPYDWNRDD